MFIYDSEFKTDKCEMIAKGFEETNSSGGGGGTIGAISLTLTVYAPPHRALDW